VLFELISLSLSEWNKIFAIPESPTWATNSWLKACLVGLLLSFSSDFSGGALLTFCRSRSYVKNRGAEV
jgi:hypothetical protein